MSESSQNYQNNGESTPLNTVTGTGLQQPEETCSQVICEDSTASCCNDKYHRKLAVCSIICGFSCCGVPALINSVKAEDADKAEKAESATDRRAPGYLRRAKKCGIISIVAWVSVLVSAPLLLALGSYLATLIDWSTSKENSQRSVSADVYGDGQWRAGSCWINSCGETTGYIKWKKSFLVFLTLKWVLS